MTTIPLIKQNFKNTSLFDQALTHRSWINENPGIRGTNERLEFLGDAILEFVVSEELYNRFSDKEEGYLTALRANLVNTINLSFVAKKLDLGPALFLSKGEDEGGGRENTSLLADTVEAIIGAIYLDQGLQSASKFIHQNLFSDLESKITEPLKDAKSRLQEKVQAMGFPTPKYKVARESGPDHSKTFLVQVFVDNKILGEGEGKSKSEAEQVAAESALNNNEVPFEKKLEMA